MIRPALVAIAVAFPVHAQEAPAAAWALKPGLDGLDVDGDGLFTSEEIGGIEIPVAFDLDEDGLFSVVELSQGYWAALDRDDSGYLEPSELETLSGVPAMGLYEPAAE